MKRFCISFLFVAVAFANGLEAQTADVQMLETLQEHRTAAMDGIMTWTANSLYLAPAVPIALMASGWSADNTEVLRSGYITGISLLATFAITEGLKLAVRRPRPYKAYPELLHPVRPTLGYSFPSGHTSLSFATAVSLSLCYPRWYVALPSMLWAAGVGFSRLYLGVHNPSDVIAGAVLGTLTALLVHSLARDHWRESPLPEPEFMIPLSVSF